MLAIHSQHIAACTAENKLSNSKNNTKLSSEIIYKIKKIENLPVPYRAQASSTLISKSLSLFRSCIAGNPAPEAPCVAGERGSLIGITIRPDVAEKFIGKVEFSGTGQIKSIAKNGLDQSDYELLMSSKTAPLHATPQPSDDPLRTPGEVMINIAAMLRLSRAELKNSAELEAIIQKAWLGGAVCRASLEAAVASVKENLSHRPQLLKRIDDIMQTLEGEMYITKRNDNYYARLFETELSWFVLTHPDENTLAVRDAVREFILDDFSGYSRRYQSVLCSYISRVLSADPPIWRQRLNCATKFIKDKKPASFIRMMQYSDNYSTPLILSVAVKYIVLAQGTRKLKKRATKYYMSEIVPQRQSLELLRDKKSLITTTRGILLPHQKKVPAIKKTLLGYGIRPIDKYIRPPAGVTLCDHDRVVLTSEKAAGIGMSGSANILHFLFMLLQSRQADFPMADARLAAASWLCFSGGHAFSEAWSVYRFMGKGQFQPLSFNQLKASSLLSEIAITHAYNKVIKAAIALNSSGDPRSGNRQRVGPDIIAGVSAESGKVTDPEA